MFLWSAKSSAFWHQAPSALRSTAANDATDETAGWANGGWVIPKMEGVQSVAQLLQTSQEVPRNVIPENVPTNAEDILRLYGSVWY